MTVANTIILLAIGIGLNYARGTLVEALLAHH
jgi:hypothetical protein